MTAAIKVHQHVTLATTRSDPLTSKSQGFQVWPGRTLFYPFSFDLKPKIHSLDVRHNYRDKGKLPREGNRSPRDQILHPDAYRHKMRDHDHSPRERLMNLDTRDPLNQDLKRERDRGSSEFTQKQSSPFDRHGGHFSRRETGGNHDPSYPRY